MWETTQFFHEGQLCPIMIQFNNIGIVVAWWVGEPDGFEPARDWLGQYLAGLGPVHRNAKLLSRREAKELAKELDTPFLGQVVDGELVNIVLAHWVRDDEAPQPDPKSELSILDARADSSRSRANGVMYTGTVRVPFYAPVDVSPGPSNRYERVRDSWHG